jgi:hypothetical protein
MCVMAVAGAAVAARRADAIARWLDTFLRTLCAGRAQRASRSPPRML